MIGEIIKAIPKHVEGGVAAKKENDSHEVVDSLVKDNAHGSITHHYKITRTQTQTTDFVSEDVSNKDQEAEVQKTTEKKKRFRFGCCCFGKAD